MNRSAAADEIRREMSQLRGQLGSDVDGLAGHARQLVNWRHYVRAFPWGAVAAAAAVGYAIVPRRLEVIRPDAETLRQLAEEERLVVEPKSSRNKRSGTLASLARMTGHMLFRAGLAYAGQQVGQVFGEQAAAAPAEEGALS